jgi:hypothetical protein
MTEITIEAVRAAAEKLNSKEVPPPRHFVLPSGEVLDTAIPADRERLAEYLERAK